MGIIRVAKRERFVVIDKTGIEDARLSFRATGLLAYLLSKPTDWTINSRDLANRKTEGRRAVLAAMQELEDAGYLVRQRRSAGGGRFAWEQVLYEVPTTMVQKPRHGAPDHGAVSHGAQSAPYTEEGTTEETPLPPRARRGGKGSRSTKTNPRAQGTNPRAIAEAERAAQAERIAACAACGGMGWRVLEDGLATVCSCREAAAV